MITGFADKKTELFFRRGTCPPAWRAVAEVAKRKLDMLDAAVILTDLRAPPGNHMEPLKGDRKGQHSIRVNDRWRVCFVWTKLGPSQVEIVDYH
jgi:proteic killer suppression protein